ncbi:hypothetical protein KJ840_02180 [Patescibacteria group bacterium]|nr:hypothetical protein [Patescibacteria group bacterium]
MENQINVGDQKTQQVGQNAVNQPVQNPEKPKLNFWMISTAVLGFLLLLTISINFLGLRKTNQIAPPSPSASSTKPVSKASFPGTVKTGTQLGEVKSYCANGLYLVADEGTYLVNQTKMLLLKLPSQSDGTKMLSDQQYVGKKVKVVGKYPAQENFCQALICECEDYILVDNINIVDTQAVEKKQIKIEGQIDCLPHRDTGGGQTLECAFGLQGKDGMYYGLQGLNQQDLISGKIAPGKKVVITGIFTPSKDSKYNTIGTIEVVLVGYTN